ncbi:hypothetical protein LguiB_013868 [Lonicera macranthoides]
MVFSSSQHTQIRAEFELDIPPEVARPLLEKAWPQKFRTGKVALRAHLKSGVEGPPDGMDPIIWEKFVENERDPKKKKQNLQNAENRKQLTYSHTLGRCTYGLKVHQKDKVKEAKAKRKSGEVSGSTTENDELSEVFDKDPRGRVRGAGSHVTKKQMIHLGIANAKEKANKVDKEGINALKDEFKSYVQEAVKLQFQDFQLAIQGTMQSMMADLNSGSPHVMMTPRIGLPKNTDLLEFRCQSKDDDLGYRKLHVGEGYYWKFKDNFFGITLYFCHFYWQKKEKVFNVFNRDTVCDVVTGDIHKCYWLVKPDGFYFTNYKANPTSPDWKKLQSG